MTVDLPRLIDALRQPNLDWAPGFFTRDPTEGIVCEKMFLFCTYQSQLMLYKCRAVRRAAERARRPRFGGKGGLRGAKSLFSFPGTPGLGGRVLGIV